MSNTHKKTCEVLVNGLGCTCGIGDWYDDRTILNYCGHDINVLRHVDRCAYTEEPPRCTCPEDRVPITIKADGKCRVDEVITRVDTINGYDLVDTKFTGISGLPEQRVGVHIVVSMPVYVYNKAIPGSRDDLLCVDSGASSLRDENGRICGVRRFTLYSNGLEQRTFVHL